MAQQDISDPATLQRVIDRTTEAFDIELAQLRAMRAYIRDRLPKLNMVRAPGVLVSADLDEAIDDICLAIDAGNDPTVLIDPTTTNTKQQLADHEAAWKGFQR